MGKSTWVLGLGLCLAACSGAEQGGAPEVPGPRAPALKTDVGVNPTTKVITIGALNDESGPAATVGRPYAAGKRLLAARIDGGVSGLLPIGWTVRLVERDHGYDPDTAVRAYEEIVSDVWFFGTSFGTPNTTPLQPLLERDGVVAFPASLASDLSTHEHTPPLAPSYRIEAMRAAEYIAGRTPGARVGLVYQDDEYGTDSLAGLRDAARHHRLGLGATRAVQPEHVDFAPVVASLRDSGATYVLLAVLPSTTGPLLREAASVGYFPMWIGHTPAWSDKFFEPHVVPQSVFSNYRQLSVLPYWGEDVPGMAEFEATWEAWAGPLAERDSIVLLSYAQGLVQIEAARRAIASGDATRAGYLAALRSIDGFDAGGLLQPVSLTRFPYVVGTRARILQPDFSARSWRVVAPYAEPQALTASRGVP